jgi:ATP-binding cassette subfamily B protein
MQFVSYLQKDSKDCGATCLKMICKYYGKDIPLSYLRKVTYTRRTGATMLGISQGAETIGFRTTGLKLSFEQLISGIVLPCIVHWRQGHFIVVYEIKKGKITVADPSFQELVKYDFDLFKQNWLVDDEFSLKYGSVLLLDPSPKFYMDSEEIEQNQIQFKDLLSYLYPHKKYIFQFLLGMLMGIVLSLIFPFLTQSVVDIGIGNNDINFVVVMLISQVALVIGQTANNFIRNWLMLHITTKVSISLISDFLIKLMRLPIAFFDSKMTGDIMQRISDFGRIQSFLTGSIISIIIAFVSLLVYSGILWSYNLSILLIFFTGSILYALWVLLFMKRRRKLDFMRFQQSSSDKSNVVQLVTGMQEIKLNNCEQQKRWDWEKIQAKLYKISIDSLNLEQVQNIGGIFIDQIKNVLISFLAAQSVIEGEMTLGMMMAVQYILGQLNGPISQFIGFIQSTQDARISLERLNEIHEKKDEEPENEEKVIDIPANRNIILDNVTFHYDGPRSRKILDNINLLVESNKITAIVGTSGSGKTTLLKLILGFYEPTEGEIRLGNLPLKSYSEHIWRSYCGVVMQEGFIFSDSILNNIGIMDDIPDIEKVQKAAEIACIEDFINSLPMRFGTMIGNEGRSISTGQKQRILIARAAYKDAPYILFDEATNSLDANNELKIMKNLEIFFKGRTVVIVAHRLSTVKNADKIVVLEKGRIVEEGKHDELIRMKGHYYNLIKNQLELGN